MDDELQEIGGQESVGDTCVPQLVYLHGITGNGRAIMAHTTSSAVAGNVCFGADIVEKVPGWAK